MILAQLFLPDLMNVLVAATEFFLNDVLCTDLNFLPGCDLETKDVFILR